MNLYEGLYNPYTDRRTLLNPPLVNWGAEWNSLGHRIGRVQSWGAEMRLQLDRTDLHNAVADLVAQADRTLVTQMNGEMPGFAKQQVAHLRAMLEEIAQYHGHLQRLFAHDFTNKLTQSRRYSPSHVNRTLLRQVTTDLRIIEQAINQRLPFDDTFLWDSHMLYLSDLMAYEALQPLKDAGIIPRETAIITYFQRQTDIRMTPYYHGVLLGFPSSTSNHAVSPPDEFLAIPHEIGHYLYRYGALDKIPRDPTTLIATVAAGCGWSATTIQQLQADTTLIAQLRAIVPATPLPSDALTDKVNEIYSAIQRGLATLSPVAAPAPAADEFTFTPQQLQRIVWHSLSDILLTLQKSLPPDKKVAEVDRWELTQALLKALRTLGFERPQNDGKTDAGEPIDELLNRQSAQARTQAEQQLNAIVARARIEDIVTAVVQMIDTMPELSPDRSWVQQLYHGIRAYQQIPKRGDSIIPLPAARIDQPRLELDAVRRILTPRIHEVLADKLERLHMLATDWRRHWVEELFCDAYGCLIAGPVNVLGFQFLLSDDQYEHEHLHRGKHPVASLRPFIQSEMLREMDRRGTATYARIPDLLDLHWQNHLRVYGDHDHRRDILDARFTPEGQTPALTGAQVIDALQIVIDQIFDLFGELFTPVANGNTVASGGQMPTLTAAGEKQLQVPWTIWTEDVVIDPAMSPDDRIIGGVMRRLHEQFHQYYRNKPLPAATKLVPAVQATVMTPAMQRAQDLVKAVDRPECNIDNRIPVADWLAVFAVDGWSTEGPEASDDQ